MKCIIIAAIVTSAGASAHPERVVQIQQIEATQGLLWKPALVDRFAFAAPGASKSLCGVKGDWKADIDAAIKSGKVKKFVPAHGLAATAIPESFDSETNWPQCAKVIGDIRDQSNCGCCWAFAGAEAASDRMCIATNASIMVPLSAQDVCFCGSDDGCDGGQIDAPWMYISDAGAVSGGQYQGTGPFGKGMCSDFSLPHCHHHGPQGKDPYPAEGAPGCPSATSPTCPSKCDAGAGNDHKDFESDKYTFTGDVVSASGVEGIQQLIMAGGPVETAFTVFSDFENYAGGIYHPTTSKSVGGHAVRIVGWGAENGVNYWKVANSWNPYWGEKGYFRIKFGAAGIDDAVTASPNDAKWSKKGEEVAAGSAHPDRLVQIKQIEATEGLLWKPALVDRFASAAPGASKSLCGVKGDWKADMEAAIKSGKVKKFVPTKGLAAIKVPDSFDSETNWPQCAKVIGDIRDQSNCGCCWAFAGAEAASDRMCIATNASIMVPLSAQDVCFCGSDDGCDGGQIDAPWMYISEVGAVTGGQYQGTGPFGKGMCSDFSLPHCHHHGPQGKDPYPAEGQPGCPSAKSPTCPSKCDADAANDHKSFENDKYTFTGDMVSASGVAGVQQLIMAGGPVETAFTVFSDFENYAGGIYHPTTTDSVGGHAVRIVGWGAENGVNYWKVANSWNPYWGEKGYFRIKFGAAGIDDSVTASPNDAKWSKKVAEVIV